MGFAVMGEGKVDGFVDCGFGFRKSDGVFCHTSALQKRSLSNKL